MAANNSINFNINFKVNDSGLKQARSAVEQLRNLTNTQVSLINTQTLDHARATLTEGIKQAGLFEDAMSKAFNVKLGTVNFDKFKQELKDSGTSIEGVQQALFKLGPTGEQAYTKMAAGLMNVKYQTVETTTLLDKLSASLRKNLLTFASISIINKIRGSIGEAYGYVKNLDTSLNEIRIVTGKSADEMDRFAERANKAAASLGKATTDYTKASTTFYQQGLNDTEVQTRTDITLKAANTTGQDTKTVANNLTALWNGFNVGAEEAEIYVDRLAALAATTASNLDELTTAMSKTASMANVMGVSEEQLAAQIATVVSVTRQAPESVGTAFKTIYSRIADISSGAEDAETTLGNYSSKLAEMGVSVLDSTGHLRNMGEVIEEVGGKWSTYTKEQQVAIASIMGGQRQVNQITALFDNWDEYTQSIETMANAEGTLQQQQDIFMESAEGQLQKLRTEWEGVLDSLLKSDDIIKVAKSISPILQGVEKLVDAFGGGVGILQKFSPLLIGIVSPQISQGISKMVNSFQAAQTNMKLAQQQADAWNTTMNNTSFTDKYAQAIKSLGADYVSLMNTMSAEQKNDFQASMQRFVDTTAGEVSQKLSELNTQYQELSEIHSGEPIISIGTLDNVDEVQKKLEQIKDVALNFPEISFKGKDDNFLTGATGYKRLEQAKQELQELQKIYGTSLPPEVKKFQDALEEVNNKGLKAQREDFQKLDEAYKELTNSGLRGSTEGLEKYKEAIKEYIKKLQEAEQQQGKFNSKVEQLKTEQIVRSMTSLIQGVMSLVSAYKQFKNLGDIWNNNDLTIGEKLSQTLMTIGSVLTVLTPSIMAAGKAFVFLNSQETMNILTTNLNTVSSSLNILSEKLKGKTLKESIKIVLSHTGVVAADTAGTSLNTAANIANAASLKLVGKALLSVLSKILLLAAPIIAIGAIVAGTVFAIKKQLETSEERMEKTKEEADKVRQAFSEMNQSLTDYSKAKNGLQELQKGTEEYAQAVQDLNNKVLDLIATYPDLKRFMTLGKDGELEISNEGIEFLKQEKQKELNQVNRKVIASGLTTYGDKAQAASNFKKAYGTNAFEAWQVNDPLQNATEEEKERVEKASFAYAQWLKEIEEGDKQLLTTYLSSYENFANVSTNTTKSIIKDIYEEVNGDAQKAKDIIDNEQERLKRLEQKQAQDIQFSKQLKVDFNYSDLQVGDYSKVSKEDISKMFNIGDEEIASILGISTADKDFDKLAADFRRTVEQMAADANMTFKELPEQLSGWSDNIDLGIIQKFEDDISIIDNEILQKLGIGLENLSKDIDIDAFTNLLDQMDWSQGEESLSNFNEQIKALGLSFEELPQEVQNYIEAQLAANSTWNKSISILGKLSSAIGKISTMKFGDTLSEKDYGELIEKYQGLEKYFQKVGDKYQFIAKNNMLATKTLREEYKKEREELLRLGEAAKNVNNISQMSYSNYTTLGAAQSQVQSAQRDLKSLGTAKEIAELTTGYTEKDIQEMMDALYLSESQFTGLQDILGQIQNSEQIVFEHDKEVIYATIQTQKELNEAVQNGEVSQKAANEMFEIVHEREIALLEEQRQKTLDLIKTDEEYKRSQTQNDRSNIERQMEGVTGNKWVELYRERENTFKEEEQSLNRQQKAVSDLLDIHKQSVKERIKEIAITEDQQELTEQQLEAIVGMINNGSTWAEIEAYVSGFLDKNSDTYKQIQEQYELVNGEARTLKEITQEILDLEEDRLITINKTNSGLKESWEIQKNASQRRTSKIEDRMAHATGQEWLDLYNQKQDEKKQYRGILNTEYTNINTLVGSRKAELEGVAGFSEYITYDENNLATLKEGAEVNKDLVDKAQEYNDALKERIELGYEIEDLDKEQYIIISKTVDEQRALSNTQRELNKLEKEAENLTGDALTKNLERQKELREENLKIQKKQIEESKKEQEDARTKFEGILKGNGFSDDEIKTLVQYDSTNGISNLEDIFKNPKIAGSTFAETLKDAADEVNDLADQTKDLEDAFEEATHTFVSYNYDEETRKKALTNKNDRLEAQRDLLDPSSPEYKALTKQIGQNSEEYLKTEQKDYNDYIEGRYTQQYESTYANIPEKYRRNLRTDENGYITNVEDLQTNRQDIIDKAEKEGRKLTESEKAEIEGLNKAIEASVKLNGLVDERIGKEKTLADLELKRIKDQTQNIEDSAKNDIEELNKKMTDLKTQQENLYGDNLIANLQAQRDLQEQIVERIKQEVQELEELIRKREDELELAEKDLQKADVKINGKKISEMSEEEKEILKKDEHSNELLQAYEKAQEDVETKTLAVTQANQQLEEATRSVNEETAKTIQLDKELVKQKLKIAEDAIKRETTAQHELATQLKEVDRAIQLVKKDQEGLSGPALIAKLKEEIALQQEKKEILEQQLEIINNQIKQIANLYSTQLSARFGVNVNFQLDSTGVSNLDSLYGLIQKLPVEQQGEFNELLQQAITSLNGLSSSAASTQSSIDSMTDSIDSLNKKIKDTEQAEAFRVKEEKWYLEEQAIKKVSRALAQLQRIQKHLTGNALIANLTQQQKLLEKQAEAQKRKLDVMKGELLTMQAMLALQGVMFTNDGLIANYAEVVAKGNDKLNGYLKSYQSLYDQVLDLEDSIEDTIDKQLDLEYEKAAERLNMFNAKVDVELDLGKAKREWQSFKREFLNTLNGLEQLNDSIAEKAKQNILDLKDISGREVSLLTDHVNEIMNEIHIMQAGGWSDLYGTDQKAALDDLANYRQQLQDSLQSVADKIKEVEEAYLEQAQKIKSKFDDQLDNYGQIQSIIEHDMNLIKLLRGESSYDELANYYDKSTQNYEAQIGFLRNQVDYWKKLMDQAQPGSKEWEEFQANWKNSLANLNSAVDAAIQNLIDKYENAINSIMEKLEKAFTGGTDLSYMKQLWDWQNQEADLYLDKIAQEYNIQKLTYKYQEAANNAVNPTQRAKILKIMDEELEKLKEKDKLTKYDVERAEKIYDLRMKQLELEDESQNKTSMRLRRDAEGNYRYEYVADQDKVAELKQEILDMEESIRQFDLDSLREKKEEAIQIIQDFNDQARELTLARLKGDITEEEYNERMNNLVEHFNNIYNASAEAIDNISNNLRQSTLDEMLELEMLAQEALDNMTNDAIEALIQDISPIYNDTINQMIDRIAGAGGFISITSSAMESLKELFADFNAELREIEEAAGVSFSEIINGIDGTIDEMQALIEDNDELLNQYEQELDVIASLIDELHSLEDAYRDVYDAAMDAVDAALELRQTEMEAKQYGDIDSSGVGSSGGSVQGSSVISSSTGTKKNTVSKKSGNYNNYVLFWEDGEYKIGHDNNKDLADKVGMVANVRGASSGTSHYQVAIVAEGSLEELKKIKAQEEQKEKIQTFATGGYTGQWGSEGRIAMLHEKELVLNRDDTTNILQAVREVRASQRSIMADTEILSILSSIGDTVKDIYSARIDSTADAILSSASAAAAGIINNSSNMVTNNINANFPNAGNMNEIRNAIMNLPNYASQKVHTNSRMNTTKSTYTMSK